MQKKEKLYEFIRFCIVGVLCTVMDAVIFYIVREFASYPIALVSGYILSLIVNYFLTVIWTFRSRPNFKNALGVLSAHMFNLFVVRMGLMYFFVNVVSINDRVAYVPTLLISVVTNFIIVKLVINKTE